MGVKDNNPHLRCFISNREVTLLSLHSKTPSAMAGVLVLPDMQEINLSSRKDKISMRVSDSKLR